MNGEEVSDYSDLTAGQYEGKVLKRERGFKWQPYWCVLYGRLLTFYESDKKSHVAGRIEIQPGSRCDKGQAKNSLPCVADLFHRDYYKLKKYSLKLRTKKGVHLFTYENVNEQTRWQIAMNNASQIDASGVRLSWIPTPFSLVNSQDDVDNKRHSLAPVPQPAQDSNCNSNSAVRSEDIEISVNHTAPTMSKAKSKHDDTHTLIVKSDSEHEHAYSNPSLHRNELVTSL